jgi:hypothetical protein
MKEGSLPFSLRRGRTGRSVCRLHLLVQAFKLEQFLYREFAEILLLRLDRSAVLTGRFYLLRRVESVQLCRSLTDSDERVRGAPVSFLRLFEVQRLGRVTVPQNARVHRSVFQPIIGFLSALPSPTRLRHA